LLAASQKAPQQAEILFESAKQKEVVEGKLQEAIQLYQRIVQDFAANRPVAAKALLRMGQCYEKLGQADARTAYERLVRDFGDQTETAAEARGRLAALAGPAATRRTELAARLVWPDASDLTGSPSSDGRLMATTDWTTGDIAIRDLGTGETRRVTTTGDIMKSSAFGFFAKLLARRSGLPTPGDVKAGSVRPLR
jgi:tetratricopeptide (TPR) repeat protein